MMSNAERNLISHFFLFFFKAEDGVNPEDTRLPPFIADMEGKAYTFQVRVTAFNFTEHHNTFTITRIAEDHGRLTADDVVNNVSYVCIVMFK